MRMLASGLVLALTACGSSDGPASSPDALAPESRPPASAGPLDPVGALDRVPARVRDAGSVRFSAVVESSRDGRPSTVDVRVAGELDLTADAGDADLDLVALTDVAQQIEQEAAAQGVADANGSAADLADVARTRLSWTADEVTGSAGGQTMTEPRDGSETALLARIPEEPAGLLDVVGTATDVTVVGEELLGGAPTTRVRGAVDPRAAVDTGLGTSGQLAIAALPSLPVEVWLDAAGLPRRVRYTVALPALAGGTRTMVTTYDYSGWGEPVDLTS